MWRQASLPDVAGGILPPEKNVRREPCSKLIVACSLLIRLFAKTDWR
jgi:hypothetical protein